jgi:hypothetical protein
MIRTIRTLALPLLMAFTLGSQAFAQGPTLDVSKPTKDGKDIVTVRVQHGAETKSIEVVVPVEQGLDPKIKAQRFKDSLDKKIAAEGLDNHLGVKANGPTLEFVPQNGATVRSLKLTGATGERDSWKASTLFEGSVELAGFITGLDGLGEPSVLAIGTARGDVEIAPAEFGSIDAAMKALADGLADIGIQSETTSTGGLAFTLSDEDQGFTFESTDTGLVITGELAAERD